MTRRFLVRVSLSGLLFSLVLLFAASVVAQPGIRGGNGGMGGMPGPPNGISGIPQPPIPPNGISGIPQPPVPPNGISGIPRPPFPPNGISGMPQPPRGVSGISGMPQPPIGLSGINGGPAMPPSGISGGISGMPRGPMMETIWYCIRCNREVSRGNIRPTGPCPHCSNGNNPGNGAFGGGWNQPSPRPNPPMNPGSPSSPFPSDPLSDADSPFRKGGETPVGSNGPGVIGGGNPIVGNAPPETPSDPNQEWQPKSSSGKTIAVIVGIILVIAIFGIGAVMAYKQSNQTSTRRAKPLRKIPPRRRYHDD